MREAGLNKLMSFGHLGFELKLPRNWKLVGYALLLKTIGVCSWLSLALTWNGSGQRNQYLQGALLSLSSRTFSWGPHDFSKTMENCSSERSSVKQTLLLERNKKEQITRKVEKAWPRGAPGQAVSLLLHWVLSSDFILCCLGGPLGSFTCWEGWGAWGGRNHAQALGWEFGFGFRICYWLTWFWYVGSDPLFPKL